MKIPVRRSPNDIFIHALACGCLLAATSPGAAQTSEAPEDELAPIVLEDRGSAPNAYFDDETVFDDETAAPAPEVAATPESYDATLQRLFFAYKEAVYGSMFDEADTLAKQIVELSIRVNGLDSRKTAIALTNLAVAQHGTEDYSSAILNYSAAIGIIERIDDMLATGLINPLRGLGAAEFAQGNLGQAKDAFDRAVHISHVNDGPHNLEQIETLLSLSETYLAVGKMKDAVNIQKRIFYLQARNIAADSLAILPALQTRASWQRRMQMYEQERFTWRRIIKILENEKGKNSLELIDPLTDLGNSYLAVVYTNIPARVQPGISSGEPYLKRAIRIAERNPDSTLLQQIGTKIELGDYFIMTDRAGRAHNLYRSVWDLLSQDDSLLDMRADLLESGPLLRRINPPRMLDDALAAEGSSGRPPGHKTGNVVFGYTVSTRGRATDIRLLEADPQGLNKLYQRIGREIRLIVHRPQFVDREPADNVKRTFSHEFFYQDKDLKGDLERSGPQAKGAGGNAGDEEGTADDVNDGDADEEGATDVGGSNEVPTETDTSN